MVFVRYLYGPGTMITYKSILFWSLSGFQIMKCKYWLLHCVVCTLQHNLLGLTTNKDLWNIFVSVLFSVVVMVVKYWARQIYNNLSCRYPLLNCIALGWTRLHCTAWFSWLPSAVAPATHSGQGTVWVGNSQSRNLPAFLWTLKWLHNLAV